MKTKGILQSTAGLNQLLRNTEELGKESQRKLHSATFYSGGTLQGKRTFEQESAL